MGEVVCVLGERGDPGLAAALQRALARTAGRGDVARVERSGISVAVQGRGDDAAVGAWGPVTVAMTGTLRASVGGGVTSETAIELARAWCEMGDAAFDNADGDLAAVVYDARHDEIVAGRTVPHGRPLFVGGRAGRWLIASEIGQVVAGLDLPWTPDAEGFARFVVGSPAAGRRTVVHGVERIVPGELWRMASTERLTAPRRTTCWSPPSVASGWTRDRAAAALRASIDTAVLERLPPGGCAVAMSGGPSSTAVWTSVAAHAAAESRAETVVAVTNRDLRRTSAGSERVHAVLRHTGGRGFEGNVVEVDPLTTPEEVVGLVDQPCEMHHAGLVGLFDRCRAQGLRVVLTGCGGRERFAGTTLWVAESLRRGQLRQFALGELERLSRRWSQRRGRNTGDHPFLGERPAKLNWLSPALRESLADGGRHGGRSDREWRLAELASTRAVVALENLEQIAARAGVEVRHPLADRWVTELAIETPGWVLGGAGRPFELLRRAQGGRLPPEVEAEGDMVGASANGWAAGRVVARWQLTRRWLLVDAGVADERGLRRLLDRIAGVGTPGEVATFWRIWAAETCLRSWARSDESAQPPRSGAAGPGELG